MNKDIKLIKEKIDYYKNSPWSAMGEDIDYDKMIKLYNEHGLEYVLKCIKQINSLSYHKDEYLCGCL